MTDNFIELFKNYASFQLQCLIGSGAFSQVYKAVLKETSKEIAVKCYKKNNISYAFKLAASEIAFIKVLCHPNITQYVAADLTAPCLFLAMEYSPYGSLANMLDRSPFPESFVRPIIKQIVSAVDYLQSLSISHGDIKPANIIINEVNPDFKVKLVDFGFAEVVRKGGKRRQCGSLYYMAPELLLNLSCDLTTDLYSIGVVMHQLLFKHMPFSTSGGKEKHLKFLQTKTKLVVDSDLRKHVSNDCFDLLEKFLSHNKSDRPVGQALRGHPFLEIVQVNDKRNHYSEGFRCIRDSTVAESHKDFGKAYIKGMEAIIHFQIFLTAGNHDAGLDTYVESKLNEYIAFCSRLEKILRQNVWIDPENLRSALSNTPKLLMGYDMCTLGQMYVEENHIETGKTYLKDGLIVLSEGIKLEPEGSRKRLLRLKINEWHQVLKEIQRN